MYYLKKKHMELSFVPVFVLSVIAGGTICYFATKPIGPSFRNHPGKILIYFFSGGVISSAVTSVEVMLFIFGAASGMFGNFEPTTTDTTLLIGTPLVINIIAVFNAIVRNEHSNIKRKFRH